MQDPWQWFPASDSVTGSPAPSTIDVGERPSPIFTPAGRHRRDIRDYVALAVRWSGPDTPAMRTTHRSRRSIPARSTFAGFRFPPDVIVLAVRWYLRFGLSYRDVEELLAERGIEVDHVTIYRWVRRFTRLLAEAARPCRHAVGTAGRSTRPT